MRRVEDHCRIGILRANTKGAQRLESVR